MTNATQLLARAIGNRSSIGVPNAASSVYSLVQMP